MLQISTLIKSGLLQEPWVNINKYPLKVGYKIVAEIINLKSTFNIWLKIEIISNSKLICFQYHQINVNYKINGIQSFKL